MPWRRSRRRPPAARVCLEVASKQVRRNSRPWTESSNCWCSMMSQPPSTRTEVTACTMPGWFGAAQGEDVAVAHGVAFSQHSTTLRARPPRAVSLYLSFMSAPVSRIVLIALSRETWCCPSPRMASPGGGDRLHRRHGVAFDARDLHQPADRVAGQPEVVLDADLGGVLDLLGRRRRAPRPARRRHGAGRADLALAADLGTGDGGVLLEQQRRSRRRSAGTAPPRRR